MAQQQRYGAIFAQPSVDKDGRKLLEQWYGMGVRLFILWASSKQTSGKDRVIDRAEQRAWRKVVAALGSDARYADYPLDTWKSPAGAVLTPTKADLDEMLQDPACYGFYGPDEPNLSPPVGGNIWRMSVADWLAFWTPILDADPNNTKQRLATFSGEKLTASWPWYKAQDLQPYLVDGISKRRVITIKLGDWYPKNRDFARYGNDLPGRAIRALSWAGSPEDARGFVCEISNQKLDAVKGRGPTGAEIWEQYKTAMAERVYAVKDDPTSPESQPIMIWCGFPQEPHPSAAHVFDASTPEQKDAFERVLADFAPIVANTPIPPSSNDWDRIEMELDQLRADYQSLLLDHQAARSTITVLQTQSMLDHQRISALENTTYVVVPKPPTVG